MGRQADEIRQRRGLLMTRLGRSEGGVAKSPEGAVKELRQANEILRNVSAYLAQVEFDRRDREGDVV